MLPGSIHTGAQQIYKKRVKVRKHGALGVKACFLALAVASNDSLTRPGQGLDVISGCCNSQIWR